MDEKMIVFSKWINIDDKDYHVYSLYTDEERRPIFTNKKLAEFSANINRQYPEISRKISEFYKRDFSGDLPKEIDLSKLDPDPKAKLIESIAKVFVDNLSIINV